MLKPTLLDSQNQPPLLVKQASNVFSFQDHHYQRRLRDIKPDKEHRNELRVNAKELYFQLTSPEVNEHQKQLARRFLNEKLEAVSHHITDFPNDIDGILSWIEHNNNQVGKAYRQYLNERQGGAPRRFFSTKSHALNFLQCAAPTKLVDGSWLYGFARYWKDIRYATLTKIYLEELGEGQANRNHVVLYKQLLRDNDCNAWNKLSEDFFTQGAVQLALGFNTDRFLPEAIGFNLGYEQLPLHLLITAYELNELDIGPQYFTLHVTIDNVATGHARRSLQALMEGTPLLADKEDFYQRVRNGYKLTQLGLGTTQIISAFNLEQEFLSILKEKSLHGKNMHADICQIEEKSINQWLSDPAKIPQLIEALIRTGWIKRHQDPMNSRFWKLIEGDQPKMFGVFNAYEKQVIYDWIAGDCLDTKILTKKLGFWPVSVTGAHYDHLFSKPTPTISSAAKNTKTTAQEFFDMDICHLEQKLSSLKSKEAVMETLSQLMSPAFHHTPVGLMATRLYSSLLEGSGQGGMHPLDAMFSTDN